MKDGRTLESLAQEIQRQRQVSRDFLAPTKRLEMKTAAAVAFDESETAEDFERLLQQPRTQGEITIEVPVNGHSERFGVGSHAHGQLSSRLHIPKVYYDRMVKEAPELLAANVNHWFKAQPETRMVRTLDGNVRAFLSDRYRALDNYDLADAVLPILHEAGVRIESCEITERRMYIKAVNEKVTGEVKTGDVVQAGVCISNSEVGSGSLSIQALVYRLVCSNGMIRQDGSMKRHHLGRKGSTDENGTWEMFRGSTRQATDRALWMQVRDVTRASMDQARFAQSLKDMRAASNKEITGDLPAAVEVVKKQFSLSDGEGSGILRQLAAGGDLSQWGMVNAITRHSQDVDDYDRATELEAIGGQVLTLPSTKWGAVAVAAD